MFRSEEISTLFFVYHLKVKWEPSILKCYIPLQTLFFHPLVFTDLPLCKAETNNCIGDFTLHKFLLN